ncbi:MAG TPA: tetratricopeptide repeat protein [Methylibium sp.]|nr:tetratricopeptide repeat protein [Methylibium sp.]
MNPAQSAGDAVLDRARSGAMALVELLDSANRLQQHGDAESSARLYEAWLAHTSSPHHHVACYNWGTVLGALRRHADAELAYRRALAVAPDFLQARLNLGHQLEHQGRIDAALTEWQQVVARTEGATTGETLDLRLHAINSLARVLEQQRRFPEAEAWMRRSLEAKAAQFDVIQHYVHIRQKQCEWPVYAPVGEVTPNQLLVGTSPLAMLSASDDPALQLMAAQRFVHDRVPKPPAQPLHVGRPPRTGRTKIGYLSGDLHMHAVGLLTAELYELHDRERFEVHAFCWSRDDGTPLRARLLAAFDQVHRIGQLDDAAAAALIAEQGIDVLVDLQGLTSGARPAILGYRAAPVQVSYLGFPGTCGLPGVDHVIADRFVMPPELLPYCTERAIVLPHCYQVSDRRRDIDATPTRAACGLPEDAFVYCSFNNNFKFSEDIFRRWMRVLHATPGSVLWLLADNDTARENMLTAADAAGVARERLIFAPRVAPADYLARLQLADLFLDTFPYNAGTTASDCLWMGTPILTLAGRSYISRMAGSLLNAVGLPDLVTHTPEHYERLAIEIGRYPARAASYKRYLAEHGRSSALFDVPAIVRAMEAEFERLALGARGS